MITLTVTDLAGMIGARLNDAARGLGDHVVTSVVTDSRQASDGAIYVARQGANANGVDYVGDAIGRGAIAVIAQRCLPEPTLVVADPGAALTTLAAGVRDATSATVVAVTGSVGKTTTKDLIAAVAGASRSVVAAQGSFNTDVGVPLTVCRVTDDTQVLVAELGARGPGQIARLARWLRPDIAVVTAVAGAHLELFETVDEVARAKTELVASLGSGGTAVLNGDDQRVRAMSNASDATIVTVSAMGSVDADVVAAEVVLDDQARPTFTAKGPWGSLPVSLPLTGAHHVTNALLALAAGTVAGADPVAGAAALATAALSTGRSRLVDVAGVIVIDDSYNANPTSTLAALDAFAAMRVQGRRVAVLGVMAEIGRGHAGEHRRVGERAAAVVDRLVVVGEAASQLASGARGAGLCDVALVAAAADAIEAVEAMAVTPGDAVLVKASRVAGLERVVDALCHRLPS